MNFRERGFASSRGRKNWNIYCGGGGGGGLVPPRRRKRKKGVSFVS